MGTKDITGKTLFSYNEVFADIVNVLLFDGERIISPDELEDFPLCSVYAGENGMTGMERDVGKRWKNQVLHIASIGIENQTKIDSDMPLRVIAYDGEEYRREMDLRKETVNPKTSETEIVRDKSRYPVITVVLYFGSAVWDTPRKLSDCFDIPEKLKPYFNDYKLNIFHIPKLTETQIQKFQSDFNAVAYTLNEKNRENGTARNNRKILDHPRETLYALSAMADNRFFADYVESHKDMEGVSMVSLWEEVENQGIAIGKAQGVEIGKAQGMEIGKAQGYEQGEEKATEKYIALIKKLTDEQRFADLARVADDADFRRQCLSELEQK